MRDYIQQRDYLRKLGYRLVEEALVAGNIPRLKELTREIPGFPQGQDDWFERHWISHAISAAPIEVIRWMLEEGAPVDYRDFDGTPLHAAIRADRADKYEIMRLLLAAGADQDFGGEVNDTPSHLAAALNDVEALKVLQAAGANLWARLAIDNGERPLDEAIRTNAKDAIAYLQKATEDRTSFPKAHPRKKRKK